MSLSISPPTRLRKYLCAVATSLVLGGLVFIATRPPAHSARHELQNISRDELVKGVEPLVETGWFDGKTSAAERLAALTPEELDALDLLMVLTPRERLQRILDARDPRPVDVFRHMFILLSVADLKALPTDEAFEIIAPNEMLIPAGAREALYAFMANNAVTEGERDLSAVILQHAFDMERSGWPAVRQLVAAFRHAERPVSAYRSANDWLKLHREQLPAETLAEAEEIVFALALESGHPDEALNECLRQLAGLGGKLPVPQIILDRAWQAARLCGRTKEILPWMKRLTAAFPEATQTLEQLRSTAKTPSKSLADYRLWARRAGEAADMSALASDASYYYERLIVMGELDVLDRLYPLAIHTRHVPECLALLRSLDPLPDGGSALLALGRLIAANGTASAAISFYEEWLATHPRDRETRREYCALLAGTGERAVAVLAFEKFLRDFPGDAPAIRKLAALRLRAGQHEAALRDLDQLAETDFDAATAGEYRSLAEALDRPESLLRALRVGLRFDAKDAPRTFLQMAGLARHTSGPEAALDVLREAVSRLPDKATPRLALATALMEEGRHEAALAAVAHDSVRSRPEAREITAEALARSRDLARSEIRKAQPASSGDAGME